VVVSFETIEHLAEAAQERFLDEVRRVLGPGGIFVVSTPDKETYAEELHQENEFHEREFTAAEFRAFLSERFGPRSLLRSADVPRLLRLAHGLRGPPGWARGAPAHPGDAATAPAGGRGSQARHVCPGPLLE
jgi:SAM-dependent methyltransferase